MRKEGAGFVLSKSFSISRGGKGDRNGFGKKSSVMKEEKF